MLSRSRASVPSPTAWALPATALAAAGLIYLAFRAPALRLFTWADALGLSAAVAELRAVARDHAPPDWVLFSLPDALWQLAFAFTLFRLSRGARAVERAAWCAAPVAIGLGLELGQAAGAVPGTFDPVDLTLSIAAVGVAWAASATLTAREIES